MTVRWDDDGREEDVRITPDTTFVVQGTLRHEAFTDLDGLVARLETDPLPVFLQVLREYGPSLTALELKDQLSSLRVGQAVLDGAWKRTQGRLKKHPQIQVRGSRYKWFPERTDPKPEPVTEPEAQAEPTAEPDDAQVERLARLRDELQRAQADVRQAEEHAEQVRARHRALREQYERLEARFRESRGR